jgi:hypothetical protein
MDGLEMDGLEMDGLEMDGLEMDGTIGGLVTGRRHHTRS